MAALSGLALAGMAALTTANTVQQFGAQRSAATGAARQGAFEQGIYNQDAAVADLQAQDAIARGTEAELRYRRGVRGTVGSQRAALAAQGVDLAGGSAADVQAETTLLGELDALTIRNNARREAWGFQVQATDLRARGQLARMGGDNTAAALRTQSIGTLLTGASQLTDLYRNAPRTPRGPTTTKAPSWGPSKTGAGPGGY